MIELRNVAIRAGTFCLSEISFRVNANEYAVLMGPTGQGKTTILEAICGLRRISAGTIRIRGEDVSDWNPAARNIGYVPQDLALFPTMTVQQHISFALKLRRLKQSEIAARVEKLAADLGVTHLLSRSVSKLSGGEAQRVALGRALSFHPSVLLLDEPFSALDEETRSEMHSLLRHITAARNVTTLHVTHNSEEAAALASRRFRLKDGSITDETESN